MQEFAVRHPYVIGFAFAAFLAAGAFNVYRAGMAVGQMTALSGDVDKLASELLGG